MLARKDRLAQIKRKSYGKMLKGGYIDRATYERRQLKGVYPSNMTYDDYIKREEVQRKQIDGELADLKATNEAYQQFYKENPDMEEVRTQFDENGNPSSGEIVTKAESKRRQQLAKMNKFRENPFGKIVQGLTDIADEAVDLPFVPTIAKEAYKKLGPPTSKFYDGNIIRQFQGRDMHHYISKKLSALTL